MKKIYYLFLILFLVHSITSNAQQKGVKAIIDKIALHNTVLPVEKLYVTIDKPYYALGDTLWFKAYLLDANNLSGILSKNVHIELLNDSSIVIASKVIAINENVGWGEFSIDEKFSQSNYTLRAYTNLQQNFGTDYFYLKKFAINKSDDKSWIINAAQQITPKENEQNVVLAMKFSNLKKEVIGLKDVELTLMSDKKAIQRATLQTDLKGQINTSFLLAEDKIGKEVYLLIQEKLNKERKLILPISLISKKIDLQFMPEGGDMLENQFGKVAFKAIGVDGLGVNVSGKIINNKNELILTFQSSSNGMGNFLFYPKTGETYKAVLDSDINKSFPLPEAQKSGTSLRVSNGTSTDSIYISLRATPDKRVDESYALMAQTGKEITYAANINLKNGFFNLKLAKNSFPVGITHFTLFSPQQAPLNERIVMIGKPTLSKVEIETNKLVYAPMDSIAVNLNFESKDQLTAKGSYSVLVTDDSQVKSDSKENIQLNYLFTSELKGNIENPSWYFENNNSKTIEALDNLLLTQGWVGYDWKSIFSPIQEPKFKPESSTLITGKLTNLFKKPVSNIKLTLLSFGKEPIIAETLSNANGKFAFDDLPAVDSVSYSIKIKNARDKASGATITLDEFEPSKALLPFSKRLPMWYNNTDSTLLNYFKGNEKRQKELLPLKLDGVSLKEVTINGVRKLERRDMGWSADLKDEVTEAQLLKIPRKSVLDVLYERVKGFNISNSWLAGSTPTKFKLTTFGIQIYTVSIRRAIFIVDGINTNMASPGFLVDLQDFNAYLLNYLEAADVKSIQAYSNAFYTYIVINTRSGSGPWIKKAGGLLVYKPLQNSIPKTFYSPKYSVKPSNGSDSRATIYWAPNIVPDEKGNYLLSFYGASKPSTYTITVEGTDLNGNFTFETKKIKVEPAKAMP